MEGGDEGAKWWMHSRTEETMAGKEKSLLDRGTGHCPGGKWDGLFILIFTTFLFSFAGGGYDKNGGQFHRDW